MHDFNLNRKNSGDTLSASSALHETRNDVLACSCIQMGAINTNSSSSNKMIKSGICLNEFAQSVLIVVNPEICLY